MTTKQLDKLLFAQGDRCFFCRKKLERSEACVEHLVAKANGGSNETNDNCVACCKAVNSLMGSLPLKHKIEIILNQEGPFRCPSDSKTKKSQPDPAATTTIKPPQIEAEWLNETIADLKRRGNSRPTRRKTLASTIAAIPKLKGIKDSEISDLMQILETNGVITFSGDKVSYSL